MTEVSTELASEYFQNGGDNMPTLAFRSQLEIQCMKNTTETEPVDTGRHMRDCIRPQIAECKLE